MARVVPWRALVATPQTISGNVIVDDGAASQGSTRVLVVLDDQRIELPVDPRGHFEFMGVPDGNRSVFVHAPGQREVEIPCRMLGGRGLMLGAITIRNGELVGIAGFDGYHFGFVDDDRDGFHDHFADGDGTNDVTGDHYGGGHMGDGGTPGPMGPMRR